MNQHPPSSVKAPLDEGIAGGKILNDVLVFHIIDLDDVVGEVDEELVIEGQSQDGEHVCDVGFGQGIFAPEGEESVGQGVSWGGFGSACCNMIIIDCGSVSIHPAM